MFGTICLMDQRHGGFMGFHDWRRAGGFCRGIVGVHFCPHSPSYIPYAQLEKKPYVVAADTQSGLELTFRPGSDYDARLSGDQAFGLNRILISSSGDVALVLDMDDLSPPDIATLEDILPFETARWCEAA